MQTSATVPTARTFTSTALRHRFRIELKAPVHDVWALAGQHVRLPEYSAGIAAVKLEDGPGASGRGSVTSDPQMAREWGQRSASRFGGRRRTSATRRPRSPVTRSASSTTYPW